MACRDRISDLPDDLLQHILYFAPAKEGASTTALARRWHKQWLSSGAVNLDTRSYPSNQQFQLFSSRPAFVRDSKAALAARGRRFPLRKFTFRVEGHQDEIIRIFLSRDDNGWDDDIVDPVLSHQVIRPVEELCVDAYHNRDRFEDRQERGYYDLSVASLPSKNLRVLRISSCTLLKVPPASDHVAFPRLEELRLHFCSHVPLEGLQRVIDSAPQLAVLDLHSVCLYSDYEVPDADIPPPVTLRCPSVIALVLSDCTSRNRQHYGWTGVDLDAPMLQCFRYKGSFNRPVALKSQATSLKRLDIHLYPNPYARADQTDPSFGQCVESFSNAKVLKLKSSDVERITAVNDGETRTALFGNLQRLELEAQYMPGQSEAIEEAIAYLLHCCPVIRQLQLSLSPSTASKMHSYRGDVYEPDVFGIKDQLDFGRSVDRFFSRRRLKKPTITHEVFDQIQGLSGESFTCLQSSLRSVSLRFPKEESNCLGVRLAKFFAENAMVLEEMYIDGGNQKLHDHINHTVGRWIPSSASGFAVLPLERPKLAITLSE